MNGETLLRQPDFAAILARGRDHRETGLPRPAGGNFTDRLARSFGECIPEIGRGRVRIFVLRDVFANAVAENFFAQKTFEHANERLAFFVGDVVEGAIRFRLGRDRLLNRMGGRTCVAFHGGFLRECRPAE